MSRPSTRISVPSVLAALLVAAPGPVFCRAAAKVVLTRARVGSAPGAVVPVSRLDLALRGSVSKSVNDGGAFVPTAIGLEGKPFRPEGLSAETSAGPKTSPRTDSISPESASSADAAAGPDLQAGAEVFDGRPRAGDEPSAARRPFAFAALAGRMRIKAVELYRRADLSRDPSVPEEPEPPPPTTRGGKLAASARSGLAAALALGLGAGLVLSGGAAVASVSIWTPVFAAASCLLGLGALALAVRLRLAPLGMRKVRTMPAILGGGGLLLLGAAASPLLVQWLGLTALSLAAVGSMAALALFFEFLNGMHDAANSIATVVATKALSPRLAVFWAAFFNSAAYFFFGAHIATAIGSGLIVPAVMSNMVLVAALLGASAWNWLTVRLGIPVSSSHALIGGLVGAALVAGGLGALLPGVLVKTAIFMVLAPVLGMGASFALMSLIRVFISSPLSNKEKRAFGGLQLFTSAMLSLGHGGNDSQKTIGIITALLFANGLLGATFHVPLWVAVVSYAAMGLGTLAGGWKIVKTLGERVTSLDRSMGASAEIGAGASILLSTWLGIPVSTTHIVTGSVAGVGVAHGGAASVKWATLGKIAWAWVLTIPLAALVSALFYVLFLSLI